MARLVKYVKVLHYKVTPSPNPTKDVGLTLFQDSDGWFWFKNVVYQELGEQFPMSSKEEVETYLNVKLKLMWEKDLNE